MSAFGGKADIARLSRCPVRLDADISDPNSYGETRDYAGLELLELIALSRIVGRVHIGDALWTHAMHLNNRFLSKPSGVLLFFIGLAEVIAPLLWPHLR